MKSRPKLPPWIRVKPGNGAGRKEIASILKELNLNTVCGSAICPNIAECWQKRTATFMILGDECTRNCRFCAVNHNSTPLPPDSLEPANIAEAVKRMNLKYVVITSVTRDDLQDGGANQFVKTICEIRKMDKIKQNHSDKEQGNSTCGCKSPHEIEIEVLTSDYLDDNLRMVIDAKPTVFNHNIETVERLSKEIRIKASYKRSMQTLTEAMTLSNGKVLIKSGLMVGMGEHDSEVEKTICDIRNTGASMLTIGQYLPPTNEHWHLKRYVEPETFEHWRKFALSKGFATVASAPLVRSSYHAEELGSSRVLKC